MRKLNPPTHKTRIVVVIRADHPDHEGKWRVKDSRNEHDDDWILPSTPLLKAADPLTGHRATVQQCIGFRPYGCFRATWEEGGWKFKRYEASKRYNW